MPGAAHRLYFNRALPFGNNKMDSPPSPGHHRNVVTPQAVRSRGISVRPYPSLYQVNTRVWLTALSRELRRPAELDDIPDSDLDRIAELGFDWVWFLGVWQTGAAGRKISIENPGWRSEFHGLLPDLSSDDVSGSCFAIQSYAVHSDFGGNAALQRLRQRLD